MRYPLSFTTAALALATAACVPIETRNTVVIEQPKPLEVNVNLSGRLELVITDARQDLEQITGQKAKRAVRPEDIGLPPDASGSRGNAPEERSIALLSVMHPIAPPRATVAAASGAEADLVKSMAARNAQVRALLSAKVAGEAHTGLLAERGAMSPEQQAVLTAENADRSKLYQLRATQNGTKVEEAALAYYLQRLGYAEKGDWVEKYNKEKKAWNWVQWGS